MKRFSDTTLRKFFAEVRNLPHEVNKHLSLREQECIGFYYDVQVSLYDQHGKRCRKAHHGAAYDVNVWFRSAVFKTYAAMGYSYTLAVFRRSDY